MTVAYGGPEGSRVQIKILTANKNIAANENIEQYDGPQPAVAHNCHGKTKNHGTINFTHGKTKLTHGETKLTQGKTKLTQGKTKFTHGKTKKTNWSAVVNCEITKMQTFVKAVVEVRFLI